MLSRKVLVLLAVAALPVQFLWSAVSPDGRGHTPVEGETHFTAVPAEGGGAGGGAGSAPCALVAPVALRRDYGKLVLLADSIGTDAGDAKGKVLEGENYLNETYRMLQAAGYSGVVSRHLRPGQALYDWFKTDLVRTVRDEAATGATAFVIELGINDALKQISAVTYVSVMWDLVRSIRTLVPNATIAVMTINPCHIFENLVDAWVLEANIGLADMAAQMQVLLVLSGEALFDEHLRKSEGRLDAYFQDRVCHPNAAGRRLMGQALGKRLLQDDVADYTASATCGKMSFAGYSFTPEWEYPGTDSCHKNTRVTVGVAVSGNMVHLHEAQLPVHVTPVWAGGVCEFSLRVHEGSSDHIVADVIYGEQCRVATDEWVKPSVIAKVGVKRVSFVTVAPTPARYPGAAVRKHASLEVVDRTAGHSTVVPWTQLGHLDKAQVSTTDFGLTPVVVTPMRRILTKPPFLGTGNTLTVLSDGVGLGGGGSFVDQALQHLHQNQSHAGLRARVHLHTAGGVAWLASRTLLSAMEEELASTACVVVAVGAADAVSGMPAAGFLALYRDAVRQLRTHHPQLCIALLSVQLCPAGSHQRTHITEWRHAVSVGLAEIALAYRALYIPAAEVAADALNTTTSATDLGPGSPGVCSLPANASAAVAAKLADGLLGRPPFHAGYRVSFTCYAARFAGWILEGDWAEPGRMRHQLTRVCDLRPCCCCHGP